SLSCAARHDLALWMGSAFFLATSSGGFDNRYFSCLPQASFGTGFSSASSFHCISGNYFLRNGHHRIYRTF
ncbi:MAG: hypothetical protein U0O39_02460, partial [Akkermansia sp.]